MKKFTDKTNKTSCFLAIMTYSKNNKPGQNQPLKENTCILNVITALCTTGLFFISEVISCAKS
jgi:hypothetical protein